MGKIIISLILAVIVVRIGRSLRMKMTGASIEIISGGMRLGQSPYIPLSLFIGMWRISYCEV